MYAWLTAILWEPEVDKRYMTKERESVRQTFGHVAGSAAVLLRHSPAHRNGVRRPPGGRYVATLRNEET